jgi:FkbM family methyltransferase
MASDDSNPASALTAGNAKLRITTIKDDRYEYRFGGRFKTERRRAERLFQKEKGTIAWLDRELGPDDVFFDIGANIGIYTVFAAKRISGSGLVVAFEPHIPSASSLIENLFLNDVQQRARLVTAALTNENRLDTFNYYATHAASSSSQFGSFVAEGRNFEPVFVELKSGSTLDSLCGSGLLPAPDVVKIDVDGNELHVLQGMRNVLGASHRPRSLQIELHINSKAEIIQLCIDAGYVLKEKHWSQSGLESIAEGRDPEDCIYSAIFAPADDAQKKAS